MGRRIDPGIVQPQFAAAPACADRSRSPAASAIRVPAVRGCATARVEHGSVRALRQGGFTEQRLRLRRAGGALPAPAWQAAAAWCGTGTRPATPARPWAARSAHAPGWRPGGSAERAEGQVEAVDRVIDPPMSPRPRKGSRCIRRSTLPRSGSNASTCARSQVRLTVVSRASGWADQRMLKRSIQFARHKAAIGRLGALDHAMTWSRCSAIRAASSSRSAKSR